MNEDDFIYYKDDKNNLMSGGFSMNLLALKKGLSPLSPGGSESKGGGLHDTEYSHYFKDHIIPSFLHYQLAGDNENYSQKMSELLNVYEDHNEQNDNADQNNENVDQDGGDLYEKLLDLVTMNRSNKNRNKNKISRKEPKINKNNKNIKNNKKTKKNKKQ